MSLRRTIVGTLRRALDRWDGEPGRGEGRGRRYPDWASTWAPARQLLQRRGPDAAKGHFLTTTSPVAVTISDQWATNLIGDGATARSGHPNAAMAQAIEDAWNQWTQCVDVEGVHDLTGLLHLAVRSIVPSGEYLGQFVTTPRGELRIRSLSPEQLDPAMTREVENQQRIITGVEFDLSGRRVGYYVFPRADLIVATMQWAPVRLPAEDIIHLFEAKVPGQVRGASWLAPVQNTIHQVDSLQDALLARANTGALWSAFIVDPSGATGLADGTRDPSIREGIVPGAMHFLGPDTTITFPTVPDVEGTPDLLRGMLRQIAAGVGLPYELMTGDLTNTNYSSGKVGLEAFKRRCKALRETLFVSRMLRPIWQRWVTLEVLSGRLHAPDFEQDPTPYFGVQFLFPEWASLDPYREAQADTTLLAAGIRSRAEIIASRGRDIGDVDREFAADTFVPRLAPGAPQLENQNAGASA
jgi:lambda family phage portal protein